MRRRGKNTIAGTTPLPINIHDLLHGETVESERLELKAGWNPESTLHTLCAFANDFHNLGGGYIVLGVEERDGTPILPPVGLAREKIDRIQKELLHLGNCAIHPPYHAIAEPYTVEGRHILVLWARGGQTRPYKARVSLAKSETELGYYIRKGSSTLRARNADERELLSLAATVPFDDRVNQQASLSDLSRDLILDFLAEIESDLAGPAHRMSLETLGRQLGIVAGPKEAPLPINVGLLFFNEEPERFFPATQIDVVWFPEGAGGDRFEEKTFKGPLARMTREALDYIRRNYISETVIKHRDRAEATRVESFPTTPSRKRSSTRCTTAATRSASRSRCGSRPRSWSCSATPARTARSAWPTSSGARPWPAVIAIAASGRS